jgi:hypothetical protein
MGKIRLVASLVETTERISIPLEGMGMMVLVEIGE